MKKYNIKHIYSNTYSPQENAIIERLNRTLKMIIYKFMTQYNITKITQNQLDKILENYNNSFHSTIKQKPIDVYNSQPQSLEIRAARKEMRYRHKKLIKENTQNFPPIVKGDYVRVSLNTSGDFRKNHTLKKYSYMKNWFYELFQVVGVSKPTNMSNSLYTLKDENGEKINRRFLRTQLQKVNKDEIIKELDEGEYVVDKVLDRRIRNGKVEYKIQWLNSPTNTWERPQASYKQAIQDWRSNK